METWKPIFSQLCLMTMWLIMLMKNVKLPYTLSTTGLPGESASCRAAVRTTDHMTTKKYMVSLGHLTFSLYFCGLSSTWRIFTLDAKGKGRHYSGCVAPIFVTTDRQECQIFPMIPCIFDRVCLVLWALWIRWTNISYEQKSASHHCVCDSGDKVYSCLDTDILMEKLV